MNPPSEERWLTLCRTAGASDAAAGWYERLANAYAEPQRHYHNWQHLAECLAEFDPVRALARQPDALELALWFHDAVYDPKAADNEEQSATLAKSCLLEAGLSNAWVETVTKLVMATKHHEKKPDADAGLMADIDLSILSPRIHQSDVSATANAPRTNGNSLTNTFPAPRSTAERFTMGWSLLTSATTRDSWKAWTADCRTLGP